MKSIVKIVECVRETEITTVGQRFVEYFDRPGYFYPESNGVPTGIGLPFDSSDKNYNWIDAGIMVVTEEIHFKNTAWWGVIEQQYRTMLRELKAERYKLLRQIAQVEAVLNDPIKNYEQQKRSQGITGE